MTSKARIFKTLDMLVDSQKKSLETKGIRDQTVTDRESQDEETQEDVLALQDQPSPLGNRESDAL